MALERQLGRRLGERFPRLADAFWNASWLTREDKSQRGEQRLLLENLPATGTYLEIGAFHPVKMSNTWALRRRGWRGLSVDANPKVAVQWRLFRPGDGFVNVAVTPDERTRATLFVPDRRWAAVSSLKRAHVDAWSEVTEGAVAPVEMPAMSMGRLVHAFVRLFGGPPSLLQLDCEGLDRELMDSLIANVPTRFWPRYLLIEDLDGSVADSTLSVSYIELGKAGPSRLYGRPLVGGGGPDTMVPA